MLLHEIDSYLKHFDGKIVWYSYFHALNSALFLCVVRFRFSVSIFSISMVTNLGLRCIYRKMTEKGPTGPTTCLLHHASWALRWRIKATARWNRVRGVDKSRRWDCNRNSMRGKFLIKSCYLSPSACSFMQLRLKCELYLMIPSYISRNHSFERRSIIPGRIPGDGAWYSV